MIARPIRGAGTGVAQARESLRILQKFANWEPPDGQRVAQTLMSPGGVTVVITSADSLESLIESTAAFSTIVEIEVMPVMPVEEGLEAYMRGLAWAIDGAD